jgi:hypothetical protein
MSKTVEIQSPEQFSEVLSKSRIVVADCKLMPPLLCTFTNYPAAILFMSVCVHQ